RPHATSHNPNHHTNPSRPTTTQNKRDRPLTTTNEHQNDDDDPYHSQTTASARQQTPKTTPTNYDRPPLPINGPERQRPTTIHERQTRTTASTNHTIPKRRQAPTRPPHRRRAPRTTT
ncbi:hypothetical protein K443DRAFT_65190, partial [Laccaria amethystina LaAM-08-1]